MSAATQSHGKIVGFATQGAGGDDEARLRGLLEHLDAEFFPFDKQRKLKSSIMLLRHIRRRRPSLLVMEGTGVAGGIALLAARAMKTRYVVSSGDAVGPFVHAKVPALGLPFALYERVLYRWSTGFIGWTPYLTGRALTFGARRGTTAPGWAPFTCSREELLEARFDVRGKLGIEPDALVIGLVGSLMWNRRLEFSYGADIIQAVRRAKRSDVVALIVGDGSGKEHLERMAGSELNQHIFLPGRVPREEVPKFLAAMDVGSLPQSVDRVGSFRYTTKISEYLAARLPVLTTQIPCAYDLDDGWVWRIQGTEPWSEPYLTSLTRFVEGITKEDVIMHKEAIPEYQVEFDRERQVRRVTAFINDLVRLC